MDRAKLKEGMQSVDRVIQRLRIATGESRDPRLEEAAEELGICIEELRVSEEELHERDLRIVETTRHLQLEHKRYRDLFEFSPDGYIITNLAAVIEEANAIAVKMFNVRRELLVGKPLIVFVEKNSCAAVIRRIQQMSHRRSASAVKWQAEIKPRGKEVFVASITSSVIQDASGRRTGFRMAIRDVTETKKREQELRDSQEQLRALAARQHEIREEERSHLARELHDEFGAALTALKLDLAWLKGHIAWAVPEIHQRIDSMSKLIDITTQAVSRTATMLRPRLLDHFGLMAAIEWQAHDFQDRSGIECHLQAEEVELPGDRATGLFRIFQESLTNVARHAEATKVEISLTRQNGYILLEIHDNGRGVTKEKISSSTSLGLLGMRERVYAFGGDVKIESDDGQGTKVRIQIPIPREATSKEQGVVGDKPGPRIKDEG
jgi:PAS domain S-box-containing protein